MTVEEMLNFETNKCISLLSKSIETQIIDGVYTVSQKAELDFNEEEIKKMLLMFKPMQKELRVYKKALALACEDIRYEGCKACRFEDYCSECKYSYVSVDEYLEKARKQNNDT